MIDQHKDTSENFGIWTLPATVGAYRAACQARFQPAHWDAVERQVRQRKGQEIARPDVLKVIEAIENNKAAICEECGIFHAPPACEARAV